jgi:hypothetical protein
MLGETLLGELCQPAWERAVAELADGWDRDTFVEQNYDRLDRLGQQCGGTGPSLLTRDRYED